MSGEEVKALCNALLSAFDPNSFDRMVRFGANKHRYQITAAAGLEEVVFQVVSAAEREGWSPALIRMACEANPGNPELKEFCARHPALAPKMEDPVDDSVAKRGQEFSEILKLTPAIKKSFQDRVLALSQRKQSSASAETRSYYYFYISLDKLERLGERVDQATSSEPTVEQVVSFAKERGRNEGYRERCRLLNNLLRRLSPDHQVQHLNRVRSLKNITPGWGYAEIELKFSEESGSQLLLGGTLPTAELRLSCSKRFFFDFDPVEGKINLTSTNHWFFGGQTAYRFLSHILIVGIDVDNKVVLGSPVYLALSSGVLDG